MRAPKVRRRSRGVRGHAPQKILKKWCILGVKSKLYVKNFLPGWTSQPKGGGGRLKPSKPPTPPLGTAMLVQWLVSLPPPQSAFKYLALL